MLGARIAFVIAAVAFSIGFWMYETDREPYPALILPTFTGRPLRGDIVRYNEPLVVVYFADGKTQTVPFERVIPPTPLEKLALFTAAVDDAASDATTSEWLSQRIVDLYPGEHPVSAEITIRRALYNIHDSSTIFKPTKRLRLNLVTP